MSGAGTLVIWLTVATLPLVAAQGAETILLFGAFDTTEVSYRVVGDPRLARVVESAFYTWQRALYAYDAAAHLKEIRFVPADEAIPARITVVLGAVPPPYVGYSFPLGTIHPDAYAGFGFPGLAPNTPAGPGLLVVSVVDLPLVAVSGGELCSPSNPPSEDSLYILALHEIGHAFGLGHASRGTMSPWQSLSCTGGLGINDYCFSEVELRGTAVAYEWVETGTFSPPPSAVSLVPEANVCVSPLPGLPSTGLLPGGQ